MGSIAKFCFLLCMLVAQSALAKTESSLEAGMVNPGYEEQPQWFKKSFLDLDEDIAEAKESGKRLMIFFYQDGCPYCKKILQDNFGQRDIANKTKNNFDVVSLNIWGDREISFAGKTSIEKDFAANLKVMYTPTLIFFNEQGKAVLRTNGYYHPEKFNAALDYVLLRQDKKQNFRSYLSEVSPAKTKGKIHKKLETIASPYDFSVPSKKYRLEKFDVAVVDMWSEEKLIRPDGKQSSIKDWAKELNIQYAPSLVYFDLQGKEVFRSDAYLRAFHIQSIMDYVSSEAYKKQPNFQRYIDDRAHHLREQGIQVDIMH